MDNRSGYLKKYLLAMIGTAMLLVVFSGCVEVRSISPTTTKTLPTADTSPTPQITDKPTLSPQAPASIPTASSPIAFVPVDTEVNSQGYTTAIDERGAVMVMIPSGEFSMGLSSEQVEFVCAQWQEVYPECSELLDFDYTLHEVTISRSFWIDAYEVSNADYEHCVKAGVCDPPQTPRPFEGATLEPYYGNSKYATFTYEDSSWNAASTYCEKWRYGRLPSEAEWEYAARGTDARLWPWGNRIPAMTDANFIPEGVQRFSNNGREVDSYPNSISPFGLFNMAGNALEWVQDWYGVYPSTPATDPAGPPTGSEKIAKGGGYFSGHTAMIAAFRDPMSPEWQAAEFGFRCVRNSE